MKRGSLPEHLKGTQLALHAVAYGCREYATILLLREEIFVKEQGVPQHEEVDTHEALAWHYLLCAKGKGIGAGRWRKTARGIKIERMGILKAYRGKGFGAWMLEGMLKDIKRKSCPAPASPIYLHAQEQALNFYRQAGFVVEGEGKRFFECNIPHICMVSTSRS